MTTTTQETPFKNQYLTDYANLLKENGFDIYYSPGKYGGTYFYFTKDNKIGYCQYENLLGFKFSTVNKPCKECGTGFSLQNYMQGIAEPTIQNALDCFIIAPNWARPSERAAVKKYKSMEEKLQKETILKYVQY